MNVTKTHNIVYFRHEKSGDPESQKILKIAEHLNNNLKNYCGKALKQWKNKSKCFSVQLGISILWDYITFLNVLNWNLKLFLNF